MSDRSDSDRARMQELLDALYAARIGGELERLAGLFADAAHFRISGASGGKPIAISVGDADGIRGWLAVLLKSFTLSGYEVLTRVIDGEQAAVHWRAVVHSRITGASIATEFVDMVVVRDGKISAYTEFFAPV